MIYFICRHICLQESEAGPEIHTSPLSSSNRFLQTQLSYIMILKSGSMERKIALVSHSIQVWKEFVLILHHWIRKHRGLFVFIIHIAFPNIYSHPRCFHNSSYNSFINTQVLKQEVNHSHCDFKGSSWPWSYLSRVIYCLQFSYKEIIRFCYLSFIQDGVCVCHPMDWSKHDPWN